MDMFDNLVFVVIYGMLRCGMDSRQMSGKAMRVFVEKHQHQHVDGCRLTFKATRTWPKN